MATRKSKAPSIETETEDKGATKVLDQGARDFINVTLLFEKILDECYENGSSDLDYIEALAEGGKTLSIECGNRLSRFAHPEAEADFAFGDEASRNTGSTGALIAKRIRRAVYLAQTALHVCEPNLEDGEGYERFAALISRNVALEALNEVVSADLDALDAALGVSEGVDLNAMYCARAIAGTEIQR